MVAWRGVVAAMLMAVVAVIISLPVLLLQQPKHCAHNQQLGQAL